MPRRGLVRAVPTERPDYAPLSGHDVGERLRRKVADAVVRKAGLWPGDRALEIACGPGLLAVPLARSFHRIRAVGVDARREASERFRANAKLDRAEGRAHVVQASPEALPFRDEWFRLTVAAFSLSSLDEPLEALAEAHRVTEWSGKLLLVDVDFSRLPRPPRGLARHVLGKETEEAMREMGYGKIQRQKLDVLAGGAILELLSAKRFDADEDEPDDET